MPIMQNGRCEISSDEMRALMGGHPPPADPKQRNAYFAIFQQRVEAQYGESGLADVVLLAGCAPPEFEAWSLEASRAAKPKAKRN